MGKFINFLFALGNTFWAPFVIFKTYLWYSPEVGFDLPNLTYLNIFAIIIIFNMFKADPGLFVEIQGKKDGEDATEYKSVAVSAIYAVGLLMSYLLHQILF